MFWDYNQLRLLRVPNLSQHPFPSPIPPLPFLVFDQKVAMRGGRVLILCHAQILEKYTHHFFVRHEL